MDVEKKCGPFARFGGSSNYSDAVVKRFPSHKIYVEPFAGAASCLFSKPSADREILTDLSDDVINALRFVKSFDQSKEKELQRFDWVASKKTYDRLLKAKPSSPAAKFHRFIYLTRFGFSCVPPFVQSNAGTRIEVKRFRLFAERLKKVEIYKMDYRQALEKFDSKGAFFFVDPPYPGEWNDGAVGTPERGEGKGRRFDLTELGKRLNKLSASWMLVLGDTAKHRKFISSLEGKKFSLRNRESQARAAGGGHKIARKYFVLRTASKNPKATKAIVRIRTSTVDAHSHVATVNDANGNGTTSRDAGADSAIHSHRVVNWSVLAAAGHRHAIRRPSEQQKLEKQAVIQSLILSKDRFKTIAQARAWIKANNFKLIFEGKPPDETENSFRFRQRDPNDFVRLRTRRITEGVQAVVGPLKRQSSQKSEVVCQVTIEGDSIIVKAGDSSVVLDRKLLGGSTPKQAEEDDSIEVQLYPVDKAAPDDKQIAFGEVLVPNEADAHKDFIKPEEVERAAHLWLARFQDRGVMHRKIVNSKVEIFESFIAPTSLTIGGRKVKKGTWLLMLHVLDSALWQKIKKGELGGLSMGGFARRVKV